MTPLSPHAEPPGTGALVAILGGKAGCGTTTVAANLAVSLARRRKTCLLDMDFTMGDVAGTLDMWDAPSMNALFTDERGLSPESFWDAIARHPSGLWVLTQPFDLEQLVQVHAQEVQRLLSIARSAFEVVVADCGSRVDETMLSAAVQASQLVLLTAPDVPSLRDTLRILSLLRRVGIKDERIVLVVNRWSPSARISNDEIADQLGLPVRGTIERDRDSCWQADFSGQLLDEVADGSAIVGDLERLRALLLKEPEPEPVPRRPWWRWNRRARKEAS